MEKLHTKFSALNADFDGPSLDFLGSMKPAHEGIEERYPRESCYFSDVGQSFVKTVADKHGHAIGFRASREHYLKFLVAFYLETKFFCCSYDS